MSPQQLQAKRLRMDSLTDFDGGGLNLFKAKHLEDTGTTLYGSW